MSTQWTHDSGSFRSDPTPRQGSDSVVHSFSCSLETSWKPCVSNRGEFYISGCKKLHQLHGRFLKPKLPESSHRFRLNTRFRRVGVGLVSVFASVNRIVSSCVLVQPNRTAPAAPVKLTTSHWSIVYLMIFTSSLMLTWSGTRNLVLSRTGSCFSPLYLSMMTCRPTHHPD